MFEHIKWHQLKKLNRIFSKYLIRRVGDAMILRVASSLSYTSLIAVVPLIAVAISIFTFFPVFENVREQVQDSLIEYFMPNIEQNVQNYIAIFVNATTKLTTLGIIGIAITAIF